MEYFHISQEQGHTHTAVLSGWSKPRSESSRAVTACLNGILSYLARTGTYTHSGPFRMVQTSFREFPSCYSIPEWNTFISRKDRDIHTQRSFQDGPNLVQRVPELLQHT